MHFGGERASQAEQLYDYCKGCLNLPPLPPKFAPRDAREFVEDLHSNDTALSNQRFGLSVSWIVRCESVNQNIRIDEPPIGHWPRPGQNGIPSVAAFVTRAAAPAPAHGWCRASLGIRAVPLRRFQSHRQISAAGLSLWRLAAARRDCFPIWPP